MDISIFQNFRFDLSEQYLFDDKNSFLMREVYASDRPLNFLMETLYDIYFDSDPYTLYPYKFDKTKRLLPLKSNNDVRAVIEHMPEELLVVTAIEEGPFDNLENISPLSHVPRTVYSDPNRHIRVLKNKN